jgi:hypothetical protein
LEIDIYHIIPLPLSLCLNVRLKFNSLDRP